MNLPRSYRHVRVTGYEPPGSYHHMLTTIHEPTRSWHNISRSKCSIIAQIPDKTKQEQQHFRLAQPHAARRNRSRPPGGTYSPPGANAFLAPLFSFHRLVEHTLPPGAM